MTDPLAAQLAWARSLPPGPEPRLPAWTGEGLRDGDRVVPVPASVERSMPPVRVGAERWVVLTRAPFGTVAPAILDAGGGLDPLPRARGTLRSGIRVPEVHVSPDGARVAYGVLAVDLATGATTELPHVPRELLGWTDEGLVYEGDPFRRGAGTTWLLRPDGSTVRLDGPDDDVRALGRGAAGFALSWAYGDDGACVTVHRLAGAAWEEEDGSCPGTHLGEVLDLSPDGRWLLTDGLPRVWDAQEGRWASLDVPGEAFADTGWRAEVGWEDAFSFLLPVLDRRPETGGYASGEDAETVTATVQVVRCTVTTGACERAGEERRTAYRQAWFLDPAVGFAPY
ncbi:hypothetical protein [Nocardioides solisilvae]|uniref:hypothetical protein n=1 Tax=Nocardioides solisilvae TaxID=1542435 RepID=UPI0013A5996D|nr:hypothetical protein [Nocardioides solisilvae]